MKKTLLFAAAVLALAACSKESLVKEDGVIDPSKIVFNIQVENADATKGIKTAWESGDGYYYTHYTTRSLGFRIRPVKN